MRSTLGTLADDVDAAVAEALALVPRIAARDHTVWQDDPTEVADRLGWLDAPERAAADVDRLRDIAEGLVADGISDVVLTGMGGSSLYPEVLATTFGSAPDHPRLHVLDSTDPGAVLALERNVPWSATVVVAASKSGGTIETRSHLARFTARLEDVHGGAAARYLVAITDPGSDLDALAADAGFRAVVHGQPDVGGRFSALTPFGLLPAAILGIDLEAHLAPASGLLALAQATDTSNTPVVLGAVLAAAARRGRDKLTLLLPDEVATFGAWVEQLVAESTGKQGVGIVPVLDEDAASLVGRLGEDRVIVALGDRPHTDELAAAGAPVVQLPWDGPAHLGAEVVRWEVATAVAGALLGVNPFDQPDVQSAKTATARVLEAAGGGDVDLPPPGDPAEILRTVAPGGYLALLAFVTPGGDDERHVRAAAKRLRDRLRVPVTVGIGPRYLHSTGQLHKGGPAGGAFLVVVGDDPEDADVPGRPYTFSQLERAQAAGDLEALRAAGRPVVHLTPSQVRELS
jgi:transaldolase / glucose-6-phosphate isomerase